MSTRPDAEAPAADTRMISNRGPEAGVAAVLMALALLVITDSLRVGIGWADDGPRAGYFPFYIGLLLFASSAVVLVQQLLRWKRETGEFAERGQVALVVSVFVPMLVYVGLVSYLGIYVASVALIAYFMRRHGKYGWAKTVAVSLITMLVIFGVFERWFLVPLPKGPIEHLFGL